MVNHLFYLFFPPCTGGWEFLGKRGEDQTATSTFISVRQAQPNGADLDVCGRAAGGSCPVLICPWICMNPSAGLNLCLGLCLIGMFNECLQPIIFHRDPNQPQPLPDYFFLLSHSLF